MEQTSFTIYCAFQRHHDVQAVDYGILASTTWYPVVLGEMLLGEQHIHKGVGQIVMVIEKSAVVPRSIRLKVRDSGQ